MNTMSKTKPDVITFEEGLLRILEEKDSTFKSRLEFGTNKIRGFTNNQV